MNTSTTPFRGATTAFAVLLAALCVWLLLAELSRPALYRLPTDAAAANLARQHRSDAKWAAVIGVIRGDLWSELAFTYANLIWDKEEDDLEQVHPILDRALGEAPHQSEDWLLLATLASPSLRNVNQIEALRMSYYTGSSELYLVPLRFSTAINIRAFEDPDLRLSISRDVRLLLQTQQTSVIAAVYNDAPPAAKQFIEQAIRDIDPSALDLLRRGGRLQSLPN